ncbi:MAG TPA: helix-turn-helix domain-containing protein [Acidobacteriota bacterium]|nr:helix-turn-helix domain-containing protein [Acidobacteriota bacterium]
MVSLGEELKRERELREITLREISEATKISVRILEAIEHDNYKILPGGVFNRNFLRAYAGFIGLDPEMIVRKYQQRHVSDDEEELPPGLGFRPDAAGPAGSRKKKVLWLVAFGVLSILAVAAYLLYGVKHP